ncbi:MAG: mandelate racemase/muconate lactonizing enzyme family protein [Solobacterium sp.]|nr:mandelate racemase/muconate lactonizing enzyme family protein [Solobacterium sp.]
MKITDVYAKSYRWPKDKPIQNGKHIFTHNELNLAVIETDEGITGYGTSYNVDYVEYLKPFLIGEDPLNVERLFEKMYVPKFLGRRSISTRSISALDIALWDIRSKAANMPLYKLLGGYRDSVPCYIAGGYYGEGKGIPELQAEMEEYMSWGVKNVKMKVGVLSLEEDARRVKAVREVIGDDVRLMVDANCAYRAYEALELSRMIEDYHPYWFEEPVMQDDYEGMRYFAEHSRIPLATGENEYTIYGFRDLIDQSHPQILNPDACSMGGITQYLKISAYAEAHNIAMSPHGQQQVHVHLDCAVPGVIMAEFYPPQYDAKIYESFVNPIHFDPKTSTVSPNSTPGTGLDINCEFLKEYRIK